MEEKKEKKTIKCSYAVLVIILCATVAFLTDYIVIDRKTKNCDCPKCEATNNEVISGDIENKDNTDNTQVTENKTYSYGDIAGLYSYSAQSDAIPGGSTGYHLYLNSNGTFYYEYFSGPANGGLLGNYIINGNSIKLNFIFSKYSNGGIIGLTDGEKTLLINSKNEILDETAPLKENSDNKEIILSKDDSYSLSEDKFMDIVDNYVVENNANNN